MVKAITPQEAFEETPYVAVYGTLKRGFWNNHLLADSEFVGEGYTVGKYELFDVGFPYAVPSKKGLPLKVEVYRVPSPEVLEALDFLEGYPEHYLKRVERIRLKDGRKVYAWIYYTLNPQGEKVEVTSFDEDLGIEYLQWP
jgi:gamma-glutamylcyclotransferase (GGCT)/AIG2-like uncharacterized protein YtfP